MILLTYLIRRPLRPIHDHIPFMQIRLVGQGNGDAVRGRGHELPEFLSRRESIHAVSGVVR